MNNNCLFSGLNAKQKKHTLLSNLCLILAYALSAFTFMNFLYCFSDCIGSIVCSSMDVAGRDALRSMPIFLSFFVTVGFLMICQAFYRNESPDILKKKVLKHACCVILFGCASVLYTVVMTIAGRYLSIVEGAPSPLYPLDSLLYAVFFILIAVCAILYVTKFAEKHPFAGVTRARSCKKAGFIRGVGMGLWLLISLYGFCGFFYSLFIVDFAHGYLPYSLAIMLVSLLAFVTFAVWEFYYNNLTEESKKKRTLPLALVSLAVSVLTAVLYFIALKFNLDGPSNVGFGILPVAFSASVNFATLFVVATPLVVSLVALIKGLVVRKKSK